MTLRAEIWCKAAPRPARHVPKPVEDEWDTVEITPKQIPNPRGKGAPKPRQPDPQDKTYGNW